jgi:hypothetical protein
MGKKYSAQYFPVNGADYEDEKLFHRDTVTRPRSKSRFLRVWLWLIHGVLISVTLLFFTLWARAPSKDDVHLYSPANEAIESKGIVRFNGSWDRPSVYRGSPSPGVEAAWNELTKDDGRQVDMTLEQLLRTGGEPAPFMVRYPEEYGGNYLATLEVFHYLHCIERVRQSSLAYYMKDDPNFVRRRTHPNHCIETLRQAIMCQSDVTMVTYDWVEGLDDPYPNFNIPHQCRDFEKILDWINGHHIYVPQLIRQEGNIDLPSPP